MVDQPAYPITITYWEGDDGMGNPFTRLTFVKWTCGSRQYYAHADESMFGDGEEANGLDCYQDRRGNWEHRGIPLPVRRALAELIFPPLSKLEAEHAAAMRILKDNTQTLDAVAQERDQLKAKLESLNV